jgi:hypothetical protein
MILLFSDGIGEVLQQIFDVPSGFEFYSKITEYIE